MFLSAHVVVPSLMLFAVATVTLGAPVDPGYVSLEGEWRFQIDRDDTGVKEKWFNREFAERVQLPGGLAEQGIGDPVTVATKWIGGIADKSWFTEPQYEPYRRPGNIKIPFWLQPERYYAGPAWFQREFDLPSRWAAQRVVLFLERPHWETRVWLDGKLIGTNSALATPHEYDLGTLQSGRHTVTIRVDNRLIVDIGENSHSISDHTQGNWNGIVGKIELRVSPLVWLDDLQVHQRLATRTVLVKGTVRNATAQTVTNQIGFCLLDQFDARPRFPSTNLTLVCGSGETVFETEVKCGNDVEFWDEFNPHLYELTAELGNPGEGETKTLLLGFREISTEASRFLINGRKAFFRGTLECAIFPKTGHPPTDEESWERIITTCKSNGLNMIRFHSWCPPEAAFAVADRLGFYFHVEASSWANQSTTLGDGKPVDKWIYEETERILKRYGNHPSFILMAYGNEPGGPLHAEYLSKWLKHVRERDSRRLYTSGAGWPQLPENQWHCTPDPRIQAWGQGLKSRINAKPPETETDYRDYISTRQVPVISHEIGQWCVYPDFKEVRKYTGYLKPRNFEIFQERLNANGLGSLAEQFLMASGKLQALCYKEDIESALRTSGMGGFQLLDLHDFPGQGTALVGVLDPFWEEKGYITAEEYSRFCNSTVPLARFKKRVFTTDETLEARLEIAHFGSKAIEHGGVGWTLVDANAKALAGGFLVNGTNEPFTGLVDSKTRVLRKPPCESLIPVGHYAAGRIALSLKGLRSPGKYKLVVATGSGLTFLQDRFESSSTVPSTAGVGSPGFGYGKQVFENDWNIWIYPARRALPQSTVLVTSTFHRAAEERLARGGKVLLTVPAKQVRNFEEDPVRLGFSSIFWNTAWTRRQAPTSLGILCDPQHPALADFPTDFHSDWQWWYLLHRAGALRLDLLPRKTDPIVRIIDDWVTARPLGLMVEGQVGKGRIIVCGFDLTRDSSDPVSTQMLASLTRYLDTSKTPAGPKLSMEQVRSLMVDPRLLVSGLIAVRADSESDDHPAEDAADGDPKTFWHTEYGRAAPPLPHELVFELKSISRLRGLTALPRQDGNPNGTIKQFEIFVSSDGQRWDAPIAKGEFSADDALKTVRFTRPAIARFLKLRILSGHAKGQWASMAEVGFFVDE